MKIILFILITSICSPNMRAQSPKVEWVKAIGGEGNDRANGITTDADGNIIIVGRFQSKTITVDDFTLRKNKADSSNFADLFILKLNPKGKVIWSITAGNYGDDHALSCATDQNGNIYVVGWFESETLSFGKISLKNHNFIVGKNNVRYNSDMWVAKFSPQGKCLWAKNAGGLDGNGQYSSIALDKNNNVIISGIAGAKMDFNKRTKLRNEKSGMFVAKYSNKGKLLWAKAPNGKGEAQGIATDPEGNLFIGGFFSSTISFDSVTLVTKTANTGDVFVAKYSPMGKVIWAIAFGGDDGEIASCETDSFGNVYLAGLFFSKSIIAGTDTLRNNGLINHFIAKFDKDGVLLWAKSAGGNNGEAPGTATREFYVDKKGNAFCAGSNWSEFTFGGQILRPTEGSEDILLLKYDEMGNEIWGLVFGGNGRNAGRGITVDNNGKIFLTGSFDASLLNIQGLLLPNQGDSDIIIIKLHE